MVILLVSVILGACNSEVVTPTLTPTETPTKLPSRTVEPLPIPTPERIPIVTSKTPTPRPTGEEVTAEIVRIRCEKYRPIVEETYELYPVDPALVLAVMAQESACNPRATDGTSVGLMQVTPKTWTPSEAQLYNVRINIQWGMYLLYWAINHAEHNPDKDIFRGVAAYNCGWISLDAGKCLWFGGPTYARRVLNFWLPYFE